MNRNLNFEAERVGKRWQAVIFACIMAIFAFFLLFTNVNLASAQEDSDAKTSKSLPAIEQILRIGLTPSLTADSDQETSTDGSRVAMFRLYNKWTGEHFYTSSKSERDDIVKAGWVYEQIEWYAPTSEDFKPVYRLYNKYVEGGDHHYTTSADEKDECVKAGWTYEGEGWRTVEAGATDYVKVLRQYNPYATTGTHNYTTDEDEQKYLLSLGWRAEADGGWGGYSTLEPSTQAIDFTKAEVDTADKTYTSEAITPKATVTGLTAGTDYVVTYSNNVNAGTATIKIEGKGDYTGSKEWKFTIKPLDISSATVTLGDSLTYNATEQTQTVSKVVAGGITLPTSDYTVSDNKQTNAGTYALKVTGTGNFKGSKQVSFSIEKANPEYDLPTGLTGIMGEKLSSVDLSSFGKTKTLGTFTWDEADTEFTVAGEQQFPATFTPEDAQNYNVVAGINLTVNVFGVKATFVANAPSGKTATVDGDSEQVVKTWDFDAGESYHTIVTTDFPSVTIDDTSYFLAGWTTDASDTYGPTQLQMVGTTVDANVTYYAVWRQPTSGYWLGSAEAGLAFADEAYFAANDPNYHSASEIQADMQVLKKSSNDGYDEIKAKWDAFYDNADSELGGVGNLVRLYATYEGGENEVSYDNVKSDFNKYVEFRILEVSGADGHLNTKDVPSSTDGSVVTFMATHALPTAYQMDELNTKGGGWEKKNLRAGLQENGSIFKKFSSGLTGAINKVEKRNHIAGGSSDAAAEGTATTDSFWIISYAELYATGDYSTNAPTCEGTAYQFCIDKSINVQSANSVLALKTRAGATPGSCDFESCNWWLRSPKLGNLQYVFNTTPAGIPYSTTTADNYIGVVPCFCF